MICRVLAFCLLLSLAPVAARAADDPAATAPKVVLQLLPDGGIEAAGWTLDDRYIITAVANSRAILIWSLDGGYILDRLVMPRDAIDARANNRILTGITADPDGRSIYIDGVAYPLEQFSAPVPVGFRFKLDMLTRVVTSEPAPPIDMAKYADFEPQTVREALTDLFGEINAMSEDARNAILLPLPRSHDGQTRIERSPNGLLLIKGGNRIVSTPRAGADNGDEPAPVAMVGPSLARLYAPMATDNGFSWLSPDGRRLAVVLDNGTRDGKSQYQFVTMVQDVEYDPIEVAGDYDELTWIGSDAVLLARSRFRTAARASTAAAAPQQPAKVVQLGPNAITDIPGRCIIAAGIGDRIFGAGAADCVPGDRVTAGLQRYDVAKGAWTPLSDIKMPDNVEIWGISVSPSGLTVAVAYTAANQIVALAMFDADNGTVVATRNFATPIDLGNVTLVDDFNIVVTDNNATTLYPMASDEARAIVLDDLPIQMMLTTGSGTHIAIGDAAGNTIRLFDADTGALDRTIDFASPYAGGFLFEQNLFWAVSPSEGLRYWNAVDFTPVATVHFTDPSTYLAVMPDGRYDTNAEPDKGRFRWLMADRLEQALAPQTFMRDYFVPGLLDRLIDCSTYGDCADVMGQARPIADLNRVLPEVVITNVEPGETPDVALVSIVVREGRDAGAPNGKTRSGVYNIQLYRNNIFDSFVPTRDVAADAVQDDDIKVWRRENALVDTDDKPGDGEFHQTIRVELPTKAGTEDQLFSAYAFNSDRVKSETSEYPYRRPDMPARSPRAFVIAVGIDAYDETQLRLDYAASDAELMGQQLGRLDGYEMRTLVAASPRASRKGSGGTGPRVTAASFAAMLEILAGDTRPERYAELQAAGIDGRMLDRASPDDIVIISFSGHGWADAAGDFYLVPADAKMPGSADDAVRTLIASWQLAGWLRSIKAGQIALILDTCHSGASVRTERFRPGPMGDSGLAQLAYDKGIRILAATQAEDVAYEDKRLKHGLLTYVLAGPGEALSAKGIARSDANGDGAIDMDEWMSYAVERLPELNEDASVNGLSSASEDVTARAFLFPNRKMQAATRIQQPTLFSFALELPIVLRTAVDAAAGATKTKVPVK